MVTAAAVTNESGHTVSATGGLGGNLKVGYSGHYGKEHNYAEIVKFNYEQPYNLSRLFNDGGKNQNLALLIKDLGFDIDDYTKITLLKMGNVKPKKDGGKYCSAVKFVGCQLNFKGKKIYCVAGNDVSFYMYAGNCYRSSKGLKRAITS